MGAAATPARAALMAETKVRFWAGAAANCLADWRRARAAGREAIVNVCMCVWMGGILMSRKQRSWEMTSL